MCLKAAKRLILYLQMTSIAGETLLAQGWPVVCRGKIFVKGKKNMITFLLDPNSDIPNKCNSKLQSFDSGNVSLVDVKRKSLISSIPRQSIASIRSLIDSKKGSIDLTSSDDIAHRNLKRNSSIISLRRPSAITITEMRPSINKNFVFEEEPCNRISDSDETSINYRNTHSGSYSDPNVRVSDLKEKLTKFNNKYDNPMKRNKKNKRKLKIIESDSHDKKEEKYSSQIIEEQTSSDNGIINTRF